MIAFFRSVGLHISTFFQDLFKGVNNVNWDLGRILSTVAVLSLLAGQGWNMHVGSALDLGPAGLGGGLAGILTAAGIFIAAKDIARTRALAQAAGDPPSAPDTVVNVNQGSAAP